jgi:hypothetical protein
MTPAQRRIVVALTVLIAATRLLAISRSMWDWDEALFTMGVREYDVPSHHPHPPGYPLFMLAAKIAHVVVRDDFRAVQAVAVLASLALFPALFFLARELRFPFPVAAGGAAICAFFPNVWYYGGTALSDIPSLVLVVLASVLLLRGRVVAGALCLGIAIGIRPQNLLIGAVPLAIAMWRRREFVAPITIVAATVIASYAGAALASSSWRDYLAICAVQSRYIRLVDSYLNPGRPSLASLASAIFIHPMHAGRFDGLLSALAAAGAILGFRHAGTRIAIAMFLPIQLFTWLMLDASNVSRYSIAFLPLYAFLIANVFRGWATIPCAAYLIVWTLPALNEVRRTDSPVAAAMTSLRSAPVVYAQGGIAPFANVFLRHVVPIERESELPMTDAPFVREGMTITPDAHLFRRDSSGHLSTFVRRHFFEVSVMRARDAAVFGDGWYGEESDGTAAWRWMPGRATMLLPPAGPHARLTMHFRVPTGLTPTLTLTLNGRFLGSWPCRPESMLDVVTPSAARNELVLTIAPVAHAPNDPRDLGLQLLGYDWRSE